MRSRDQYMNEYARNHRNRLNKIIHMICVPVIFFAIAGLGWCVSLGSFVSSIPENVAPWVNLATLGAIPIIVFYARLGARTLLTGLLWMIAATAACVAIQFAGLPLAWISAALFIVAWIGQFYGHYVEGAKPSFGEDIVFLLIGPLFVQEKLERLVRTGSI